MTREVSHEPDASRYVMRDGDVVLAIADYTIRGNSISFTHTYTQPRLRGQGLAGEVVDFAMDDVERTTALRVVPMCWYVAEWFDKHPERAALLSR